MTTAYDLAYLSYAVQHLAYGERHFASTYLRRLHKGMDRLQDRKYLRDAWGTHKLIIKRMKK